MTRPDQGFSSIGVLALAVALALLVTVGVPISVSKETVELKDWLGFAGNVVGGAMTIIAAVFAWRAVQGQVGVQREANLLELMTREEDRLETEFHALEVCAEFLMATYRAQLNYPDRPAAYVGALGAIGLSEDDIEVRRAIQQKVGGPIPPGLLSSVAYHSSGLMQAAVEVRRFYIDDNGDEPPKADPSHKAAAEKSLDVLQTGVARMLSDLIERRNELTQTLLPRLRQRIEEGIWAIHD